MIKTDITKTISQFIEEQFPNLYREEGAVLISFLTAYYEFLETNGHTINRDMFTIRDIDVTYDSFINEFRKKYIEGFPFITATDTRFLIKNVADFYRAKGSDESVKLLMKMIFDEEVDIYYPSNDILKPSDSLWVNPVYIEVSHSARTKTFVDQRIIGSESGASAIVESIVSKRINGKIIDIIYLTNVSGNFVTGEYVSDDNRTKSAPKIIGSLTDIDVNLGGSGYKKGDLLNVISPDGKNGVARITEVLSTTDAAQFELIDGGFGYTLDSDTQVYVSTAMIFCDNPNLDFEDFETLTQPLEKLTITSNAEISIGETVYGFDTLDNTIGEGVVVAVSENTADITMEVRDGSFARIFTLDLQDNNKFFNDEDVVEENIVEVQFESADGAFVNGEVILQRDIENEISTNVATGVLDLVDGSILYISGSFGSYSVGEEIEGRTSGTKATITSVNVTSQGNRGTIVANSNTSIDVLPLTGDFSANTIIRGDRSKNINTILDITPSGLDYIETGNTTITLIENYQNVSASGVVVGQTEERVGLFGNTHPFFFVSGTDNFIKGNSTTKEITRVGFGSGATFEVGSLVENTKETFIYNRDLVDSTNFLGINYLDIFINGIGSNISRVSNNAIVVDGGSGYANTSAVSFVGGGYLGGEPLIHATAEANVSSNGEIESIVILDGGQGYFEVPEIVISDGNGANVELNLDVGYGFPDAPYGGFQDILEDIWTNREITLGEIFSLDKINRGSGYDAGVFTKVVNNRLQKFNIFDLSVNLTNLNGTFAVGEVVDSSDGFRGRIRNIDNDTNVAEIKALSFVNQLSVGETLTGETSLSTAVVESITDLESSPVGENAIVDSLVVLADGIIAKVEIIDSGYGYIENGPIQLFNKTTNQLATSGVSKLGKQGKAVGFWRTSTSHLNDKKLRDNFFYQEFSYQVVAGLSFDKYEQILRDLLHTSGTELFGRVEKTLKTKEQYDNTTVITKGTSEYIPILLGSQNIANISFSDINLDPPFNSGVGRINTFVSIVNGGMGYSNNSVLTFIGGGGESGNSEPDDTAEGFVVTDFDGVITFVGITKRGSGYRTVPEVSIGDGFGAEIILNVDYGYGFERTPYSTIDTTLINSFGSSGRIFFETETVYETDKQ